MPIGQVRSRDSFFYKSAKLPSGQISRLFIYSEPPGRYLLYNLHGIIIFSLYFLFSWDLAKIPNMEIALGCITTIFGSRAAQRIAILMNLYGLKLNQDKVLQASIFLKPKARMISLRYVSKYHKFCIEDSTEGELFFDVKKLMTRGDLTPILFGSKVIFVYRSTHVSRHVMVVTSHGRRQNEEALELWMIIPSYSDSRFGVFFDIFCDTKFSVLGRSRPMLTNQKCPSHTNQPIRVNLSRGLVRSEHPTLFFYSSLPSQLVFSHSVYPNQYFFK